VARIVEDMFSFQSLAREKSSNAAASTSDTLMRS
jgi:hypothetical protein